MQIEFWRQSFEDTFTFVTDSEAIMPKVFRAFVSPNVVPYS